MATVAQQLTDMLERRQDCSGAQDAPTNYLSRTSLKNKLLYFLLVASPKYFKAQGCPAAWRLFWPQQLG